MSFRSNFVGALSLSALLLAGCGGGSDGDVNIGGGSGGDLGGGSSTGGTGSGTGGTGTGTGSGSTDPDPTPGTSPYSYKNLSVYEAFDEFSGDDVGGLYQGFGSFPYISEYTINPITVSDLESTDEAVASDFIVTVDDILVDDNESYPLLQKVIGTDVQLTTALVFDVSNSMADVDIDALVAEAKAYVNNAQANADSVIANQAFVVWAFGRDIVDLTGGYTTVTADIESALDDVATLFDDKSLSTTSNLHRAIVEVTGRYEDDTYDFSDPLAGPYNDLVDVISNSGVVLSQMVLFSSGNDTYREMTADLMVQAIESQGIDMPTEDGGEIERFKKPVFYYVVGSDVAGDEYTTLSEQTEVTESILLDAGAYSFSADLIAGQIAAIETRIDLSNQHIFRFVFAPRVGDHTVVFSSDSSAYNYSLTSQRLDVDLDPADGTPEEELASLVEITGPNGEYLSENEAELSEVSTFAPATRWTVTEYGAADYAWAITGGTATLVPNADGSATVSAITASPVTLQLTNTVLGHTETITIVD